MFSAHHEHPPHPITWPAYRKLNRVREKYSNRGICQVLLSSPCCAWWLLTTTALLNKRIVSLSRMRTALQVRPSRCRSLAFGLRNKSPLIPLRTTAQYHSFATPASKYVSIFTIIFIFRYCLNLGCISTLLYLKLHFTRVLK